MRDFTHVDSRLTAKHEVIVLGMTSFDENKLSENVHFPLFSVSAVRE